MGPGGGGVGEVKLGPTAKGGGLAGGRGRLAMEREATAIDAGRGGSIVTGCINKTIKGRTPCVEQVACGTGGH